MNTMCMVLQMSIYSTAQTYIDFELAKTEFSLSCTWILIMRLYSPDEEKSVDREEGVDNCLKSEPLLKF